MQKSVEASGPSRALFLVMAVACGVGVSCLYFPQAITPLLAEHFGVSDGAAALVATLAQLGYATGIFFVLPLGDQLPRRPMISILFTFVSLFLVLAAAAPSLHVLYALSLAAGIVTVVPQILMPMSADLAAPGAAGRAVGMLSAGLVTGMLLSRAFGGLLGEWLGWRAPYLAAGAATLVMAVVLGILLPPHTRAKDAVQHSYSTLLRTSVRLFATLPDLRRSCLYQFMIFGAFSAAWTSGALYLTGRHFGYGTGVVGLVALVGAGSALTAPRAGRLIDRVGADRVSLLCFGGLLASAAIMLIGLAPGIVGLIGLTAGLLVMDICVQCSQISNQARIFSLVEGARSRLNSAYMTSVFLGGSLGSWLGTRLYLWAGWSAVCGLIGAAALVVLGRHVWHVRITLSRPQTPSSKTVTA